VLKPYFIEKSGEPAPLLVKISRRVRFEETDPLGIVWHGHYASYFEDARSALGEKYGIGYLDHYEHGVIAPIRKMHADYLRPLRFQEEFEVEATLHWTDAARINFSYIITDRNGAVTTAGYTVQVMLDRDSNLLLAPPPFHAEFRRRWKEGELT
jgi:acyl-CoA thioester hydrolase